MRFKAFPNRWINVLLTTFLLALVIPLLVQAQPQQLPREQTLIIASAARFADPENWNILLPTAVSRSHSGMHAMIYEYFFYVNMQTGELIPWLAEKYEYLDNFTRLRVYLRKGVTWSDGYPFTADDVVFTYQLLLSYGPKLVWGDVVQSYIKDVVKVDNYTVDFLLKSPNPRLHLIREAFPTVRVWGAITIVPKHVFEGKDVLTFKNYPPVGTGPYRLIKADTTSAIFERRDDWWATKVFGIRPAPKYVIYQNFGAEDVIAMKLARNEIDAVFIGLVSKGTFEKIVQTNPDVRSWYPTLPYAWPDPCPRLLMVQNAHYPWNISEMRWALSLVIDRSEIVKLAYEGMTTPAQLLIPNYPGLKPYYDAVQDLLKTYNTNEYNPQKATSIFQKYGFKKNPQGVWTFPNGTPIKLTYIVDAGSREEMAVANVIAAQLQRFGLEVELRPLSAPTLGQTILVGAYDLKLQSFCPGDTDPYDNLALFHSRYWRPLGETAPWYEMNSFRYKNPSYDKVVDELASTPPSDAKKCVDLFRQAMEIWLKDLPVIPIAQAPALTIINTHYWKNFPTAENPWMMPVPWWATFNLVINGYKSPTTGEWVGGLIPTSISYVTVYFTKDYGRFRGIDLKWYGPFKAGDAARVPEDDADFLISQGVASLTPTIPTPSAPTVELTPVLDRLDKLSSAVTEVSTHINSLTQSLSNLVVLTLVITLLNTILLLYIIIYTTRKRGA